MINFDSAVPVKLKGVGKGFWITLDTSHPEDVLISEIDKLLKKLKHLAINADLVLDAGDAKGQEELIQRIKVYLRENFELGLISDSPIKRSVPTERIRQRDLSKGWNQHSSDVLMLRGRVRSGQTINAKKHLVITGDVNPGAELIAGGDVIVLGKLSGKVHAGFPDRENAMIFALGLNPSHIKIGAIAALGSEDKGVNIPEFASVEKGKIIVQDYMKASPFRQMPWPEAI